MLDLPNIHFKLVVWGSRHGSLFWIQYAAEFFFPTRLGTCSENGVLSQQKSAGPDKNQSEWLLGDAGSLGKALEFHLEVYI